MPEWVRDELAAEQRLRDEMVAYDPLVMFSQVNRAYHLAEPLRKTAARPWWDILAWQLALVAERDMVSTRG